MQFGRTLFAAFADNLKVSTDTGHRTWDMATHATAALNIDNKAILVLKQCQD